MEKLLFDNLLKSQKNKDIINLISKHKLLDEPNEEILTQKLLGDFITEFGLITKNLKEKTPEISALALELLKLRKSTTLGNNKAVSDFGEAMLSLGGKTPELLNCKDPVATLDITFDDIAGQTEVKKDIIKNYVLPFTYPSLFKNKAKGILLYGAPGTGKTLLVKAATAQIDGSAFYAPTPDQLKGKYEGETEKNITTVFDCAGEIIGKPIPNKKDETYRTAIIFMDEFDSIAGQRGDDPGMTRSVNSLLQAMDGMKTRQDVSVVAATNYPWQLDDAIKRRFNTQIFIDLPTEEAVEYMIRDLLIKNYAPPDATKAQKSVYSKNKEFNNWIFSVFADHTSGRCDEIIEDRGMGLMKASIKTQNTQLTEDNIQEIVDNLVANSVGQKIKNGIKSKIRDPSDIDDEAKFGYSGSDITSIMKIAIQDAAFAAMEGNFSKVAVPKGSKNYYYVSDINGTTKIGDIGKNFRDKILNFSICLSDVLGAIKKYPSTVTPKKYVEVLNYAFHGRPF